MRLRCSYAIFVVLLLISAPAFATCPNINALHADACYGTVTVACQDGVYEYTVRMAPGYRCAGLIVYATGGSQQTVQGIVHCPAGWRSSVCTSGTLTWSIPSAWAEATIEGFSARFSDCNQAQSFGLHVVPVRRMHPYVPSDVRCGSYTFFARPGCVTPAPLQTWGRLHSIYR